MKAIASFLFATLISSASAQEPSTCVGGDKFLFNNFDTLSFLSAQGVCAQQGGNLARIANEEEFRAVQGLTGAVHAWIGIDAIGTGGNGDSFRFSFTDGVTDGDDFFQVPFGIEPWDAGEPNNSNGAEACVHMNSNALFNDASCLFRLNFVCRFVNDPSCDSGPTPVTPTTTPTVKPTSQPSSAPSEFSFVPGPSSCLGADRFFFENIGRGSFASAQASCVGEGGNLARISNEEEFSVVKALTRGTIAWIGVDGRESGISGDPFQFSFTDGVTDGIEFFQVPVGTGPWESGEPNDGFENCVQMNGNSLWSDVSCLNVLNFVCRVVNDPICKSSSASVIPTTQPTVTPTNNPTATPTKTPTSTSSLNPTNTPTKDPTATPTNNPTATPTKNPTSTSSLSPTKTPTKQPTATPTNNPTATPTNNPTATPTNNPTATPTKIPTSTSTLNPTNTPTKDPTATPTNALTGAPTAADQGGEFVFPEYMTVGVMVVIAIIGLVILLTLTSCLIKSCCKTPVMTELVPDTPKMQDGGPIYKVEV